MKLILFVLLISVAFSNAFLFRGSEAHVDLADDNDVEDYFTAYYARFGLKKPEQLLKCYDKKSAALYFKNLDLVNTLVQHAEHRNRHQVHLDFAKLLVLNKALEHVNNCVAKTQDLQDLFNALNITDRNPELASLYSFIHYQANFGELSWQLPHIIAAIQNKNFTQAGYVSGCILNNTVFEIQKDGIALLALKGLQNGVHIGLGLPDAESVETCWNNETAAIRLEFIYEMSAYVAKGSPKDAAYNTEKFYEEKGKDLVNKIPEETWKCWAESADVKKESEKLSIDINSREFYDKAKKFVYGSQGAYWKIQKIIKDNLEQHNFIHSGSAYGHMMQLIANTNN